MVGGGGCVADLFVSGIVIMMYNVGFYIIYIYTYLDVERNSYGLIFLSSCRMQTFQVYFKIRRGKCFSGKPYNPHRFAYSLYRKLSNTKRSA